MEGRRLVLRNDIVIEGGEAGMSGGFLWCYIQGRTLEEMAQIFLNPSNTRNIVFEYGEMSTQYDGYTKCTNLMIDVDGLVSICMTKGA